MYSSNKNVDSSGSGIIILINVTENCLFSFDYAVSSEPTYDKLTITLNGETIVGPISGQQAATYSTKLSAGSYSLNLLYTKDSFGAQYEDRAYLSNLCFKSEKIVTDVSSSLTGYTGITEIICSAAGEFPQLYRLANYPKKLKVTGKVTMKDFYDITHLEDSNHKDHYSADITYLDLSDATIVAGPSFDYEMMYLERCHASGAGGEFLTGVFMQSEGQDVPDWSMLEVLVLPDNLKKFICNHVEPSTYKNFHLKHVYTRGKGYIEKMETYALDHTYLHVTNRGMWGEFSPKTIVTYAPAKTVNCNCDLDSQLTDEEKKNVDVLTVTGTMDIRDFMVIREMKQLLELNIEAEVKSFDGYIAPNYGEKQHGNADEIPDLRALNHLKYFSTTASSIAKDAFSYSYALYSVSLTGSKPHEIGDRAFYYCNRLTKFQSGKVSNYDLVGGLSSIGDYAFAYTQVPSVLLAREVTKIGRNPFLGVEGIWGRKYEHSASFGSDIEDVISWDVTGIKIDEESDAYGGQQLIYSDDYKTLLVSSASKQSSSYSFVINDATTTIQDNALCGLTGLSSLTLGKSVTSLGSGFLSNCPSLTAIHVPEENGHYRSVNGVLYSSYEDFWNYKMGSRFESNNNKLIRYPSAKPGAQYAVEEGTAIIESGAFDGSTNLETLTLPVSMRTVYAGGFQGCTSLKDVCALGDPCPEASSLGATCTLHVMPGARKSYEESSGWSKFTIVEDASSYCDKGCDISAAPKGISDDWSILSIDNPTEVTCVQFDIEIPSELATISGDGLYPNEFVYWCCAGSGYSGEDYDDYEVTGYLGEQRVHVFVKRTDGEAFSAYGRQFGRFYLNTNCVVAQEGVFPVVIKNVLMKGADGHTYHGAPSSSYWKVGNPTDATLALTGTVPRSVCRSLWSDESIGTLDLTHVTEMEELHIHDGLSIVAPSNDAIVGNIAYYRDPQRAWGTICLPFPVQSNENVQLYRLAGVTSTAMNFQPVDCVEAGVPVVYKLKQTIERMTFETNNVMMRDIHDQEEDVSDGQWTMRGTYVPLSLNPDESDANIYYIARNRFWYANKTFPVPAYRAWFETPKSAANVQSFRIGVDGDDEETGVDYVEREDGSVDVIYDLAGRRLPSARKGINIINNKKVMLK